MWIKCFWGPLCPPLQLSFPAAENHKARQVGPTPTSEEFRSARTNRGDTALGYGSDTWQWPRLSAVWTQPERRHRSGTQKHSESHFPKKLLGAQNLSANWHRVLKAKRYNEDKIWRAFKHSIWILIKHYAEHLPMHEKKNKQKKHLFKRKIIHIQGWKEEVLQ